MHVLATPGFGSRLGEALGGIDPGSLLVGAAFGILAGGIVAWLWILGHRRRMAQDVRRAVAAVEEVRDGGIAQMGGESDTPMGLVLDAVERLSRDLTSRSTEAAETEGRVRATLDAIRDYAVVTMDPEADIRSFSDGAAALFGWEENEVASLSAATLFAGEAYKEFLPMLGRREIRDRGLTVRAEMRRRDGSSFPADIAVRPLRSATGEPTGFLMWITDVTDRVRLEDRLRESEQRYRGLVEELGEGVLIVRQGQVLYVNPAFAELCGESPGQLLGTRLRDRISTRDVLLVEETLASLEAAGHGSAELHCRLGTTDESPRATVRLKARGIDYDGTPAVLLLIRDETLDRRVEAELRRNESQLDAVLEATSDGILVLLEGKRGGMVQMTNRAFAERFELSQQEILGLSEEDLLRMLRKRSDGAASLAGFLSTAGYRPARELFSFGGARQREVELTLAPLMSRTGKVLGRVLACRDLTDQRESERKLQLHAEQLQLSKVRLEQAYRRLDAANKELLQKNDELDHLNHELRKLDEMKSNLLANVSHDLQTPLVAIRGYTEMIQKERLGPVTDEQRKGLGLSLTNIDRLISMIDNLLVFSRSESEGGRLNLTRFSLHSVVDETADLLREKIEGKNLVLRVEVEGGDLSLNADRAKVQQVFINLISNAIKFNRDGGEIEIAARPVPHGFAEIVVSDTGVGIPATALDRIFDRHFQVSRDPVHTPEGSGIGLAIVRDIVRSHGGRIDVESEEGRGTRFRFTLPAGEEFRGESPVHDVEIETGDEDDAAPDEEDGGQLRPRFRIIRRDRGGES